MPDIMHLMAIQAEPSRVFDAIATAERIRSWWTSEAELESRVGGHGEFRFYGGSKITKVEVAEMNRPSRIAWHVTDSFRPEWHGTNISFHIEEADSGTTLRFVHQGFPHADDDYAICTTGWGIYLGRLQAAVEAA